MPTWFHNGPRCADCIIGVWTTILCWRTAHAQLLPLQSKLHPTPVAHAPTHLRTWDSDTPICSTTFLILIICWVWCLMSDVWCLRQSMFHRVGRVIQTHNQQWEFETFWWQQNITWTKSGFGLSTFISIFRISSNFCRGLIGDNIHYLTFLPTNILSRPLPPVAATCAQPAGYISTGRAGRCRSRGKVVLLVTYSWTREFIFVPKKVLANTVYLRCVLRPLCLWDLKCVKAQPSQTF